MSQPTSASAGQAVIGAAGSQVVSANLGMSPRQQKLNRLWAFYTCCQYDNRQLNWDGSPVMDAVDKEAIASGSFLPGGFYDAAASNTPLSLRRPTVPFHLVRVIVNRFTGLLFTERSHPVFRVPGDSQAEDYIAALVQVGRLWPAMMKARNYGGAQGSVGIGFKFVNGRLIFEVHDPRWCRPTFKDREQLILQRLEKRYTFTMELPNADGVLEPTPFWYRRVIDERSDVLYKPVQVGDGSEPRVWEEAIRVDHNFGEFPGRWLQNLPVDDDIDGEPDCHGVYDVAEEIDALIAQANRGIKANCDPTVHVSTDLELAEVAKGSDNAIKTEKGGGVAYVEITGAGIEAAYKAADKLRDWGLEVAQCVLDQTSDTAKTATEVERNYSSMLDKADIMREQYGQRGAIPLMEIVLRAITKLGEPVATEQGMVRQVVKLPPRIEADDDPDKPAKLIPREVPDRDLSGVMDLQWPPYMKPSLLDVKTATEGAAEAKAAGLIDDETACKHVAPYYDVEDVKGMMKRIAVAKQDASDTLGDKMLGRMHGMNASKIIDGDPAAPPKLPSTLPGGQQPQQQGGGDGQ